jgi:hypothetical protein
MVCGARERGIFPQTAFLMSTEGGGRRQFETRCFSIQTTITAFGPVRQALDAEGNNSGG